MIIDGNHIRVSEKHGFLFCTWDNKNYGEEVWLGYVYFKNGVKMESPYLLTENDFIEKDDPWGEEDFWIEEVTAEELGLEDGYNYADVKSTVVKRHYSYDDQIALMLNYAERPEEYREAYQKMQEWRDVAARIAKRLTGKE